jgi:hypothetical protein
MVQIKKSALKVKKTLKKICFYKINVFIFAPRLKEL